MGYLTALLLALPLAAQEPPGTGAVPGAAAALSSRAGPGEPPDALAEAALCLEALRKNWSASEEGLAVAISSAAAFIAAGTPSALPPAAGAELARELKKARDRADASRAVKDLARLRRALQDFFADKGGRWPNSLEELVPAYLPAIPPLRLPGHEAASAASHAAGADTGGWLYFGAPESENLGLVLIDCSHPDEKGVPWRDR
ncbi:MAG: hypothetical protein RDU13_06230 [Elusimicrobiales bacterium]|jgi:hypothetical protein|nr:hypothetical protein [Elusimicrobiales bacterium]